MLSSSLKQEIQQAYTRLLKNKGYSARYCQRRMIADIANTLANVETGEDEARTSDHHLCVVEAGTGTGKTVAYAIACLPLARALGKKLVISTATVALQEQIVLRDLPDIARHSGLEFSFALAKGRRRYLCLARLDDALQSSAPANQLAFYDDEVFATDESNVALYESMLSKLGRAEWDGDRDSWPEAIDDRAWFRVSTDHVQCTGRKCSHYQNCYFYKARERVHKVDCIVTNHDLVLSDLMMGGGAVLPAPEETIYVFDEGHHLPDKAINHFANFVQIGTTQGWLEQIPATLTQMVSEVGEIANLPRGISAIEDDALALIQQLGEALAVLEPLRQRSDDDGEDRRFRFPCGRIDETLRSLCGEMYEVSRRLTGRIDNVQVAVEDRLADAGDDREAFEHWLPIVSAMLARLTAGSALWSEYMTEDPVDGPPRARWITFRAQGDVLVSASPITVEQTLDELLWSRCFAAVVTSATLAVAGNFERFRRRAGIGPDNTFNALPSPFRFDQQARLKVPKMDVDPRDADAHSAAVAAMLPELMKDVRGGLVLFTSWRQMHTVTDDLEPAFREIVISQGTLSRAEIVDRHRARVDEGKQSVIFGLASFAEGIDLPGNYCDHVVVVKIPFSVPDDPVGATLSEWIEASGGNAFQQVMIPDAALRMVQACGRLLRTETDTGVVTILDRRLVTQRYGALLLNALPPFAREIA